MTPALNEVIHAPNRLRICAFLSAVDQADSVASKQLKALQDAGYVKLTSRRGWGG